MDDASVHPPQLPGSRGEHQLQELFGTRERAERFYRRQMLDHLNPAMQAFIARQELVFIATADAHGHCDSSLRAGLPGFVRVLGDRELIYPEYRGNGVLASLGNLSENPHIGLMFVDFCGDKIGLHVNGQATIRTNEEVLAFAHLTAAVRQDLTITTGRRPERWVRVVVDEAYIHCSKHIPRLAKVEGPIEWGTDDPRLKGGDYFGIQKS